MENVVKDLREMLINGGACCLGAAPVQALEQASPGHRPGDLLPEARSLLCFALSLPRGLFLAAKNNQALYWRSVNVLYRHMDVLALRAASVLEGNGETALPLFGCFPYEVKAKGDFWGYVSLVWAGQATGLGRVGKNGLLMNERFGPRLLLGGLITSASLDLPAWPQADAWHCPDDCLVCQEVCPVGAITGPGRVDRGGCARHSTKSPLYTHMRKNWRAGPDDDEMIDHISAVDDHSWYRCLDCVALCPAL